MAKGVNQRDPASLTIKQGGAKSDTSLMRITKWLLALLLGYGLFVGIAYILVPVLTDGWGNTATLLGGVVLLFACAAGLLRLDPRR